MSLVKIPILLCMTVLLHAFMTPPNKATPPKETYLPTAARQRLFELALRKFGENMWLFKIKYWCVALAECATILVAAFPSAAGAESLASRLSFNGHPFPNQVAHPTFTFIVASSFTVLACIGRILSYRELGPMFVFMLARKKDHTLVTTGPYAIVRHPSYVTFFMGVLGSVVCFTGRNSWMRESGFMGTIAGAVFVGLWSGLMGVQITLLVIRIGNEDDFLRKEFGVVWERWAREVPFRLIPGVY